MLEILQELTEDKYLILIHNLSLIRAIPEKNMGVGEGGGEKTALFFVPHHP